MGISPLSICDCQVLFNRPLPTPKFNLLYRTHLYRTLLYQMHLYCTMSNVTASGDNPVPTQQPVDTFSDATHEASHEYFSANRIDFASQIWSMIYFKAAFFRSRSRRRIMQGKHPQYCRNTLKRTRNLSKDISCEWLLFRWWKPALLQRNASTYCS